MAGKKQTREKKGKPPVKITLNLYVKEKKPLRLSRLIPGVLAVVTARRICRAVKK